MDGFTFLLFALVFVLVVAYGRWEARQKHVYRQWRTGSDVDGVESRRGWSS